MTGVVEENGLEIGGKTLRVRPRDAASSGNETNKQTNTPGRTDRYRGRYRGVLLHSGQAGYEKLYNLPTVHSPFFSPFSSNTFRA